MLPDQVIVKMLEISTAHICRAGAELLGDTTQELITVYEKEDFGWWLPIPNPDMISADLPQSILDMLHFARIHNCTWIMLDCDAYQVDGLPTYEW